jgi:Zn-finger nucleic acid-binding protein
VHADGVAAAACGRCGGVWLDRATLDALARDGGHQAGAALQDQEGARRCPVCGALMARTEFGRGLGLVVDVCGEHGTWFDAGELRQVMQHRAAPLPDLGDPEQWRAARARLDEETAAAAARLPRPSRLRLVGDIAGDVLRPLLHLITDRW